MIKFVASKEIDDEFIRNNLPKRPIDSNKGTFGKTLIIAGSDKYPGAALLASKAAAAIGSGLTVLATQQIVFEQITYAIPEIIHTDFNYDSIFEESKAASAVVIGPGLGSGSVVQELIEKLILNIDKPIVLDADGINSIEGKKDLLKKSKTEITLTPHPKEFARLLGISIDEVLKNRIELTKQFSNELNCNIVLKGASTVICSRDRKTYISPFANSALSKGGTGDVLSGFIGGLISQGLKPIIASIIGVYLHGKTAEIIAEERTVYSLLPQDLITYLPKAIKTYI